MQKITSIIATIMKKKVKFYVKIDVGFTEARRIDWPDP